MLGLRKTKRPEVPEPTKLSGSVVVGWVPLAENAIPQGKRDKNGDVILRDFKLFTYGAWKNGGADATLTLEMAQAMAANHARCGRPVFLTIGHPDRPDEAPAAAWIEGDLEARDDGLYATEVRVLAEFAERIEKGEYRGFSPTFHPDATDPEGNKVGPMLMTGGFTNIPRLWNLQPHPYLMSEVSPDEEVIQEMSPEEIKDLVAETVAQTVGERLDELRADLTAKPEENKPEELADKDAEIQTLAEKNTALSEEVKRLSERLELRERAAHERDIKALVKQGLQTGKLTPAQVSGYDKDPIKYLSESAFAGRDTQDGIQRLAAHLESQEPVISFDPRKSREHTNSTELSTDHPDVVRLAEKIGCSRESALKGMLRHQASTEAREGA